MMVDLPPGDDLSTIIKTALGKIPELDPRDIDDLSRVWFAGGREQLGRGPGW